MACIWGLTVGGFMLVLTLQDQIIFIVMRQQFSRLLFLVNILLNIDKDKRRAVRYCRYMSSLNVMLEILQIALLNSLSYTQRGYSHLTDKMHLDC